MINDPRYLSQLIARRQALFVALANSDGRHVVPFGEKKAQGLRFRKRTGSQAAEFPDSFVRDLDAPDLFTGFRPPQAK